MIIETELSIGDKVWMVSHIDNKIKEFEVNGIQVFLHPKEDGGTSREVQFMLKDAYCSVIEGTCGKYYFKTKQELINYLLES